MKDRVWLAWHIGSALSKYGFSWETEVWIYKLLGVAAYYNEYWIVAPCGGFIVIQSSMEKAMTDSSKRYKHLWARMQRKCHELGEMK